MKDNGANSTAVFPRSETRKVFLEVLIVGLAGLLFALAANRVSPRGLALGRNYFPVPPRGRAVIQADASKQPGAAAKSPASAMELLAVRLQSNGLQLADSNLVASLYHDPRFEQELVVFIDSRADKEYQAGHVPGAYQLDHYHIEKYLPGVLPVCLTAERIVLYCNGGECEDSEFAAITLRDAGIPATNMLVYAGGMAEWAANGLPVERGERKSGDLAPQKP